MGVVERYHTILALLFPSSWQDLAPENSRNIVFRFSGDMISTDLQILILGQGSERERYEVWRVPKGNLPIALQIDELREKLKTDDPKVIASFIRIEHFVIDHPSKKLKEIAQQFTTSCFPLARNEGFCVDCREYSFWLKSLSDSMSISMAGGDTSTSPLIQWIRAVRTAAEDQLSAEKNLGNSSR